MVPHPPCQEYCFILRNPGQPTAIVVPMLRLLNIYFPKIPQNFHGGGTMMQVGGRKPGGGGGPRLGKHALVFGKLEGLGKIGSL